MFALLLLTLAFPNLAHATSSQDEATAACGKAMGQQKSDCLAVVKNASSFQLSAAHLCSDMIYGAKITECLKLVANRSFAEPELRRCSERGSDGGKLACLKTLTQAASIALPAPPSGALPTPPASPTAASAMLAQLKSVEAKLRDGQNDAALLDLGKVIRQLERQLGQ